MSRAEKFNMMKPDWFDYLIWPNADDAEFKGWGEGDGWEMREDTPEEMRKAYKEYLRRDRERREKAIREGKRSHI